jgi:hypothetical protein
MGAGVIRALGEVWVEAVEGLGHQPGRRRLAAAARAGKEIGVRHAIAAQRMAQGLDNVFLPHDFFPQLGAPFAV